MGLPPRSAREELAGATELWHAGEIQPPEFDAWVERARSSFARINGVDAATVAIGANVSSFVGLVAGSLPRGARVVGYRGEFSSLLFPFMARGDLDVHLVELEELAGAVDARTALAVVSAAQSSDGRLAALDDITATGVRTLVDTTQATGWLALDASRFDYTACAAYKWLLSPRGTAFMTVRPERMDELIPAAAGWYAGELPWESVYGPEMHLAAGARRFDLSPSWLSWVGTAPALEYLEHTGIDAVRAHDVGLADALRDAWTCRPRVGDRVRGPPRRRRAAGRGGHRRGGARRPRPGGLPPVQHRLRRGRRGGGAGLAQRVGLAGRGSTRSRWVHITSCQAPCLKPILR